MTRLALTFIVGVFLFVAGGTGDAWAATFKDGKIHSNNQVVDTKKKLCFEATFNSNWDTRPQFAKYVLEAKRLGLECTSGQVALRFSDSFICTNAVYGEYHNWGELKGIYKWRLSNNKFVIEAKARGLTCGVEELVSAQMAQATTPSSPAKTVSFRNIFSDASDLSVCLNIASSKVAKQEADSRSLSCSVEKVGSTQIASTTTPAPKPTSAELIASLRKTEQLEAELAAIKAQQAETSNKITSDTQVPLITITASSSNGPQGTISGRVSDNAGVGELRVDGQLIQIDSNGNFTANTYVPEGGVSVIIEAIDVAGLSSSMSVRLDRNASTSTASISFDRLNPLGRKVAQNGNALALIIGVDSYSKTPARAIYADSDAKVFTDYATQKLGIPGNRIKTLVNNSADESGMLLAVKDWLSRSVKQGDTDVYIFFAGHGLASDDGEQMYLLPYDGSPRLLEKTAILRQELFSDISATNPRSVTVFLDTCYSGTTRGTDMLIASRPIGIRALEQSIPDNFTVMTAAAGDQTAKPLEEAKHGMFSYFLMKGMEGEADANNDNQITAGELHAYVEQNVVQQSSGSQTPELQGDASRVLVRFQKA